MTCVNPGESTVDKPCHTMPRIMPRIMPRTMLCGMRSRISTTVNHEWLSAARAQTGLPDSELIDRALSALLEKAEREAEDRALSALSGEVDEFALLPRGWPAGAPPLDDYNNDDVPDDVVALFAARRGQRK